MLWISLIAWIFSIFNNTFSSVAMTNLLISFQTIEDKETDGETNCQWEKNISVHGHHYHHENNVWKGIQEVVKCQYESNHQGRFFIQRELTTNRKRTQTKCKLIEEIRWEGTLKVVLVCLIDLPADEYLHVLLLQCRNARMEECIEKTQETSKDEHTIIT